MIPAALTGLLIPLGFLMMMTGMLKGFMDMTRGYPGGLARILASLALGGLVIAAPTILPALTSSTSTVVSDATGKDAAKDDTGEGTAQDAPPSLFERVFADQADAKDSTKDSKNHDESPSTGHSTETILWILGGVAAFALTLGLIAAVYFAVRHQRHKHAEARETADRARAEEETRLDRVWAEAVARHDHLREEMMRHQSDIDLVLSMPLINDQNDPKTAAFTEALAKAADLAHDTRPTSAAAVDAYANATRAADRAWGAAWRNADRVRLSNFTPEERTTIQQVAKLMQRAEHETSEQARTTYYRKAVSMLDNLIEIPAPAMEAIEQSVAGVLTNPATAQKKDPIIYTSPTSIDQSILATLTRKVGTKVTR